MVSKITSPPEPFDIFINAHAFHKATGILASHDDGNLLFLPLIVSEAFTLELYLKCLHSVQGRASRGHDLAKLFNSLGNDDQNAIDLYLVEEMDHHPKKDKLLETGVKLDRESILHRTKDLFEKARYWHEGFAPNRDSGGKASDAGIARLALAVRRRILELRPGWKSQIQQVQLEFES